MPELQEIRDIVIIAAGSMLFLVLLVMFIFTVLLGLTARSLMSTIQTLLKGEVAPLLDSIRLSAQRIQGTTAFIGETAVGPIIRVYGVFAGARRMFGALSGITGKRRDRR